MSVVTDVMAELSAKRIAKLQEIGIRILPETNVYDRSVPCGSCKRCCQNNEMITLSQFDDWESYETEMDERYDYRVLKHKPNGDCVYLGDDGCTIHDRAPRLCRTFDCRIASMSYDRLSAYEKKLQRNHDFYPVVCIGRKLIEQYPLAKDDPLRKNFCK